MDTAGFFYAIGNYAINDIDVTAPEHMTMTITMTIADRAGTGHKVT